MMIVVEGVDGTGKSSLTESLAEYFGGNQIHSENTLLGEQIKAMLKEDPLNPVARAVFYMSNAKVTLESIGVERLKSRDEVFVFDRYMYSTIASQQSMAVYIGDENSAHVMEKMASAAIDEFPKPDKVIFLYAERGTRIKRIEGRKEAGRFDKEYDMKEAEQKLYPKLAAMLRNRGVKVCEIDTTNMTKEGVFAKAVKSIGNSVNADERADFGYKSKNAEASNLRRWGDELAFINLKRKRTD
jgi:thymidylate kinase